MKYLAPLQRAADSLTAPWLSTTDASRFLLPASASYMELVNNCAGRQLSMPMLPAGCASCSETGAIPWSGPLPSSKIRWRAPTSTSTGDWIPPSVSFPRRPSTRSSPPQASKMRRLPCCPDYSRDTDADHEDEEAGFARTNAAHDRLQRFETHIRRFIELQLRDGISGENWMKERVPPQIRKDWQEKRQRARDSGEPDRPAIAYADFTHYKQIILRRDNWRDVFASVFKRETLVQESFQRLYPIRVCAMHARIVTQDDEVYLYVETKRLLAAIGIES